MEPIYFASPDEFRDWLVRNHDSARELLVGFYKRGTGQPSMTWPESVDEALCFGWIDGVRRSVDADRYTIRFSPRKRSSNWSDVNIRRAGVLIADGRMQPAGLKAFEARNTNRAGYSFEQRREITLSDEMLARFRSDGAAWRFWESQPPGYRRTATWWIMSAKREDTRMRRLDVLIEDSSAGRRIAELRRNPAARPADSPRNPQQPTGSGDDETVDPGTMNSHRKLGFDDGVPRGAGGSSDHG